MSGRHGLRQRTILAAGCCLILSAACRDKQNGSPTGPTRQTVGNSSAPPKTDLATGSGAKAHQAGNGRALWIETGAARAFSAEELDQLPPDWEIERLKHFRVRSATPHTYARKPDGDGAALTAHVLIVEAETEADAYGLMSCRAARFRAWPNPPPDVARRADAFERHDWRGRTYVYTRIASADTEDRRACDELTGQLLTRLPAGAPPELVQALPSAGDAAGPRWLLRDLGGLPADLAEGLIRADLHTVNQLLGLQRDTLICIGTYEVPQARRPNTVWLVEYPNARRARAAYDRYVRFLETAGGTAWSSTSLLKPRGRFLVGTWTAEEESLQYMMPRIAALLPS